ncbi:MAG: hypothetical protein JRH18_25505 [Deltaproteobacteria bacterium]|nr:hypothetical protein [Deltaproteobacteria bacterium]
MRGGKRAGAGRRPRFGPYRETTTMRVPAQLKQDVIAYIESICADTNQSDAKMSAASKQAVKHGKTDYVSVSKHKLNQAVTILKRSLILKANAGGAIKAQIRKAVNLLQGPGSF